MVTKAYLNPDKELNNRYKKRFYSLKISILITIVVYLI